MSLEESMMLKIQYGRVYIQIPDNDVEAIDLVLDILNFFKKRIKKRDVK